MVVQEHPSVFLGGGRIPGSIFNAKRHVIGRNLAQMTKRRHVTGPEQIVAKL